MATTILDTLKKLGAATFDRLALLVGVVDDDPATYADGDVKPARMHKTNRGIYVHVANADDISGGGGAVTQGTGNTSNPWYVLGLNGSTPERLATQALQGAGLPGAFTSGGGVKVGIVDEIPVGTNVIGKTIVRGGAKGTTAAADVTSTASGADHQGLDIVIRDGNGNLLGVSGAPLRTDPTGTTPQPVATSSNAASAFFPVQIAINSSTFAPAAAPSVNLTAPTNTSVSSAYAMGRGYTTVATPGNGNVLHVDNFGRTRTQVCRNLTADGTTDAPTRFPSGGDFVASSSGVALVKATGGRLFAFDAIATSIAASGRYLHAHNAASATTPTTSTLLKSWPFNSSIPRVELDIPYDLCFPNGIKFTISSTETTETTVAGESFVVAGYGA